MWALALGLALGLTPLASWKLSAFGLSGGRVPRCVHHGPPRDRVLPLTRESGGPRPVFGLRLFIGSGFLYGSVFGVLGELSSKALAVTLVVSLMHFWYDGFVWSVRR